MTDEEYNARVKAIMVQLVPKGTADGGETKELYELYNYRFLPKETNTWCSGCRARVYQKMLTYYNEIKGE